MGMANYLQMLEDYLADYQPGLKAELVQKGELPNWLNTRVQIMHETKEQLLKKLTTYYPEYSPLQLDMETDRMVIDMFLTPY